MAQMIRLKQKGLLRTGPKAKWMPFEAIQCYTINRPQFVWIAKVTMVPFVYLFGLDKLMNGHGSMVIKFLALFNVVKSRSDVFTDSSSMLRYLAEMMWFPSSFLSSRINFNEINATSVKVIMEYGGITVCGILKFNEQAEIVSFEADRYMIEHKNYKLVKWLITVEDYKLYDGIKIPYKCTVTWKLPEGDFEWLRVNIIDVGSS